MCTRRQTPALITEGSRGQKYGVLKSSKKYFDNYRVENWRFMNLLCVCLARRVFQVFVNYKFSHKILSLTLLENLGGLATRGLLHTSPRAGATMVCPAQKAWALHSPWCLHLAGALFQAACLAHGDVRT